MKAAFSGKYDRQRMNVVENAMSALQRHIEETELNMRGRDIANVIEIKKFQ